MNDSDKLDQLWKAMYGNGQPGVLQTLTALRSDHDNHVGFDRQFQERAEKWLKLIIVLAMAAGGSPWAARLVDWMAK